MLSSVSALTLLFAELSTRLQTILKIKLRFSVMLTRNVIENNNCDILYAVPMMLKEQRMDDVVIKNSALNAASVTFRIGNTCLRL